MPINGDSYKFSKENISNAPATAGVYALYQDSSLIYIGRALGNTTTIRSRLSDHYSGRDGRCTQQATTYKRERTSAAAAREKQLLQEYMYQHGKLPKCNNVMP